MNKDKLTMAANKVIEVAKKSCAFILPVLATAVLDMGKNYIENKATLITIKTYNDAVKVILDSSMFDSAKSEAIDLLQADRDADYYKSIASVVESSAFSQRKIDMIKSINNSHAICDKSEG